MVKVIVPNSPTEERLLLVSTENNQLIDEMLSFSDAVLLDPGARVYFEQRALSRLA